MDPKTHIQELLTRAASIKNREDRELGKLEVARRNYNAAIAAKEDKNVLEKLRTARDLQQQVENMARTRTYAAYNQALSETVYFYHLAPPELQFGPKDGPILKDLSPWNAHFSDAEIKDPLTGQWRRRTDKDLKDEADSNARSTQGSGLPPNTISAETSRDGKTMHFFVQAFESNSKKLKDGSVVYDPDTLASFILHETVHWVYAMKRGGSADLSNRERLHEDARAYQIQADFLYRLGKTKAEVSFFQDNATKYANLEARCSTDSCPEVPSKWLPAQAPLPTDPFSDPEPIRKGGEESFVDGVAQLDPITRQIKDNAEKEAQKRRDEEEQRKNRNDYPARRRQAYRCGFEVVEENGRITGFRSTDPSEGFSYGYSAEMLPNLNPDAFEAQYMIARACADMEKSGAIGGGPCNDGSDTIDAHWSDRDFRTVLGLKSSSEQKNCLDLFRDKLKTPVKFEKIKDILNRFSKDMEKRKEKERKEAERRRRDKEEEERRNQPSPPRPPRPPNQTPNPPPYRGPCDDLGSDCL